MEVPQESYTVPFLLLLFLFLLFLLFNFSQLYIKNTILVDEWIAQTWIQTTFTTWYLLLFSFLLFLFILLLADMQDLHPDDDSTALSEEFQEIWEKERTEKKYLSIHYYADIVIIDYY